MRSYIFIFRMRLRFLRTDREACHHGYRHVRHIHDLCRHPDDRGKRSGLSRAVPGPGGGHPAPMTPKNILPAVSRRVPITPSTMDTDATGFMLLRRSRELGTYLLIGLENRQVARLFFLENACLLALRRDSLDNVTDITSQRRQHI